MKIRATTAMLIKTGIIGGETLQQLVKQGNLPPGILQLVEDSPQVPESDEEKEQWITDLETKLADQEITLIRETMLDIPEDTIQVFLGSGPDDREPRVALRDAVGRLFFAASDGEVEEGWSVHFPEGPGKKIAYVEPVFVDDEVAFLVCTLSPLQEA